MTQVSEISNAIEAGDKAPDFNLPTDNDGYASLSDLAGKRVVLYFYPKDSTPGCTTESKDFRDLAPEFEKQNAVILGVSKDSVSSHNKFKEKHCLPFPLISDEEGGMLEAYDVWKEKSMYGKKFMGIERSTFLIDEKGVVQKTWRKVKVDGHAQEVLKAVKELA